MNYIGSKLSLLGEIQRVLAEHGVAGGSFCDLFSGTAIVAQMARSKGFQVIANDLQAYSYAMQQAFLETEGYPGFGRLLAEVPAIGEARVELNRPGFGLGAAPGEAAIPLARVLGHLESLPPREGRFFDEYCEGGSKERAYFAREAGARCEAMRDEIARWEQRGWLAPQERAVLLASLIESMDMLANTASVYGAYLKHIKKTARQPLVLRLPRLLLQPGPHEAHQQDALALVQELARRGPQGVLYLDPPYNHRQYHANYHVLETIARWDLDAFTPLGKTGLRPSDGFRSEFCSRKHVEKAFAAILDAADFEHVLVSYNNEGLLPEDRLQDLMRAHGECTFHNVDYRRFRADADSEARRYKGDEVREFLFYLRKAPVAAARP